MSIDSAMAGQDDLGRKNGGIGGYRGDEEKRPKMAMLAVEAPRFEKEAGLERSSPASGPIITKGEMESQK